MRPIQQTIEAATKIGRSTGEGGDLLASVQRMADKIQLLVPDCTGMSIAWAEHGVTFTLVASDEEIAVLDALQYLDGGPCVDAVHSGHGIETGSTSPLDEESWRLFARATAAAGVQSTLTFPVAQQGHVVGSINLYGASAHTFEGLHEELADILGAWAPGAVSNADLSFASRRLAEQAPQTLRAQRLINQAVTLIGVRDAVDAATALHRLQMAATRAGIRLEQLAAALLNLHE